MIDVNNIFRQKISEIQSRIPVKLNIRVAYDNSESTDFRSLLNQKTTSANSAREGQINALQRTKGVSDGGENIVDTALSLIGKVSYFWGGKSSAIGWDPKWGSLQTVSAAGSPTSNTTRPFGLDCSGFVTWAFINAGKSAEALGYSTYEQNAKSERIEWEDAQAGDLAFFDDLSHVGIVAGRDANGKLLVIHCSSSKNTVTLDRAKDAGFDFISRPNLMS